MGLHASWIELLPAHQGRGYMAHSSYIMYICSLPDMYTLSPWASGFGCTYQGKPLMPIV